MPGAWEYEGPNCLVGILTRGIVTTRWAIGFRDLKLPNASYPIYFSGMPFDHARNTAVQRMLERNFTWLFFLDDDVIPPADTIERLQKHGLDIVSGLYYRRAPPILPVMLKDTKPRPSHILEFKQGDLIEADLVGSGCLLIHRRVLQTMSKPWFDWLLDREDIPEEARCSEDFAFCRKAKSLGFRIFVDTSINCAHAGLGKSENGKFEPLDI